MSRECEICGKGSRIGNVVTHHGMPKKKGGIGLHTTGINRKRFFPNIQRIRIVENGRLLIRRVCTQCIKAGKVTKR